LGDGGGWRAGLGALRLRDLLSAACVACALSACTTINVVSGSGSIEAATDQRIGRRLGPLVGDSDNTTNANQSTQPKRETK